MNQIAAPPVHRHDSEIRDIAVGHRELCAGQRPVGDTCAVSLPGSAGPGRSAIAKVPIISPAASFGRYCLLLRVAAEQQDRLGRQIDRRGERHRRDRVAKSPRPARRPRDGPGRRRRYSSGIAAPVQPISAIAGHSSAIVWLRRLPGCGAARWCGQRSVRNRRASSRSCFSSSGKSKFMPAALPGMLPRRG